jgi:hypothetical protein
MDTGPPAQRKPFGFLILGTVIGAALGLICFKLLHSAALVTFGSVAGAVAGFLVERMSNRPASRQPPPDS